jgi:hypothetical protein
MGARWWGIGRLPPLDFEEIKIGKGKNVGYQ